MQSWGTVVVALATLMVITVDPKIYERCELAKKLEMAGLDGFQGYSVGDWMCIAYYESGFDTSFMDHNPDGSSEYGIFQLNSAWWCNNGVTPTQNLCYMNCTDLLNRHILDDIICVKRIVTSHTSMNTWDSWSKHCSGHDLSVWLKGCEVRLKTNPSKINS